MSSESKCSSKVNSLEHLRPVIMRVLEEVGSGVSMVELLNRALPGYFVPQDKDNMWIFKLLCSLLDPPRRQKLTNHNSLSDAIDLINKSKNIIVLSGAGISTSAGIPDFRSRTGLYSKIHQEFPDLEDPKSIFDIHYFRSNPRPFFKFAKTLYPGQYNPTIGHKFIKCIEDHGKLLRNYTQNIDSLERIAGIKKVVECHGSFATATCTRCWKKMKSESIKPSVMNDKIPECPQCLKDGREPCGILKPDIVFFGEPLGQEFYQFYSERDKADLLIVIGSSLKVKPVATVPSAIPSSVPQILINREPLDHMQFDIELLGDCDVIIQELCLRLGDKWADICDPGTVRLNELTDPSVIKFQNDLSDQVDMDAANKDDKNGEKASQASESLTQSTDATTSYTEDSYDDQLSLKSNQADGSGIPTSMIEKDRDGLAPQKAAELDAIASEGANSDDDWEDVEEVIGSHSSFDSEDAVSLDLPKASCVSLKPGAFAFCGAEMTRSQYKRYIEVSKSSS